MQDRDENLMAKLALGERRHMECLVERHARPLLAFITRMVGDEHLSHDLFQDVFLAVWTKRAVEQLDVSERRCVDQDQPDRFVLDEAVDQPWKLLGEAGKTTLAVERDNTVTRRQRAPWRVFRHGSPMEALATMGGIGEPAPELESVAIGGKLR